MAEKTKPYSDIEAYEKKLRAVMARLGVEEWDWNRDRHGEWVEFRLRGELYRFDHTTGKARERGMDLKYGREAFAQLVLALEDLARISERGIYELSTWIAGMRYLPPAKELPACFRELGFEEWPGDEAEIRDRYRALAKSAHPDAGGSEEVFLRLQESTEQALRLFSDKRNG